MCPLSDAMLSVFAYTVHVYATPSPVVLSAAVAWHDIISRAGAGDGDDDGPVAVM